MTSSRTIRLHTHSVSVPAPHGRVRPVFSHFPKPLYSSCNESQVQLTGRRVVEQEPPKAWLAHTCPPCAQRTLLCRDSSLCGEYCMSKRTHSRQLPALQLGPPTSVPGQHMHIKTTTMTCRVCCQGDIRHCAYRRGTWRWPRRVGISQQRGEFFSRAS